MGRVVIAGVSTRAAAASAARAGFAVTALDAFGDLDQHASVTALSLPRDFGTRYTAHAAARASRTIECDAVAYLSSFENHPRAVGRLAAGRALWGNSPEVLRRVRDPFLLAETLRRRGCATPAIGAIDSFDPRAWMVKPLRSGGGQGVRRWSARARVPRGCYLQEWIEGRPASIVFVAARGRAVPLGISYQLVGEVAFGVSEYRYCGSIVGVDGEGEQVGVVNAAHRLAQVVADEFRLVGVNGIDFIARDGTAYAIEVNPRWSSSMELIERAYGVSVFRAHAAACTRGELPSFDLTAARRGGHAFGKAIVFARDRADAGDTRSWLTDPTVADIPRPGERIEQGQPVCTIFAEADTVTDCHAALVARAGAIHAAIATNRLSERARRNTVAGVRS